jgi:GntR family transcriptional regulator
LDRRIKLDNRPLYAQAVDVLRQLIAEEPYPPGAKLPSEGELADQLGISRTTLRMAMGHLELQGVVVRRQGVGTFVSQPALTIGEGLESLTSVQSLARSAGLRTEATAREVNAVSATPEWAEILNVDEGSPLIQVQCTISVERMPVAFLNTLSPERYVDIDELEAAPGSLLEFLLGRGEPHPSHTHSQIHAIQADKTLASQLQISTGQAVIHLLETYFTKTGMPIALSFNYFVSDRFGFSISRYISR